MNMSLQARIIAQFGLISGAVALGMVTVLTSDPKKEHHASNSWKVRDFESTKVPAKDATATPAAPQLK
jgi:hypothetical protein